MLIDRESIMTSIERFRNAALEAAKEVGADSVEAAMFQGGVLLLLARLRDKCQEPWWYQQKQDNWMKENDKWI